MAPNGFLIIVKLQFENDRFSEIRPVCNISHLGKDSEQLNADQQERENLESLHSKLQQEIEQLQKRRQQVQEELQKMQKKTWLSCRHTEN